MNNLLDFGMLLPAGAASDQQNFLDIAIEQTFAQNALAHHARSAKQDDLHVRIIAQNSKSAQGKKPFTSILRNRINNFHMQLNSAMLYFDQEKVLIPALSGETTPVIRAVSRIEGPFLGRSSDSAEGSLGRRSFGTFEQV